MAEHSSFELKDAISKYHASGKYPRSELVIGLVGAIGTELPKVAGDLVDSLRLRKYHAKSYRISEQVIPHFAEYDRSTSDQKFEEISAKMDAGDRAREETGDNAILALGVASMILANRDVKDSNSGRPLPMPRTAHIIVSLKHPDEVGALRRIYGDGFFLIGVFSNKDDREQYLMNRWGVNKDDAQQLMDRDEKGREQFGQDTRGTFQLSDFFIYLNQNESRRYENVNRILDLIFGHPNVTPTFDEYCMFMAFAASLRSADLARQVGAVIANEATKELLSTGANDCPRPGGGLYWPERNPDSEDITDEEDGRDYKRGYDSNSAVKKDIISEITEALEGDFDKDKLEKVLRKSSLWDITEYGRAVHAEMEALLACGRNGLSSRGGTLYCTTFPCHNCAKHIIASGIQRVVYVEPYPKSKAFDLHGEAVHDSLIGSESELGEVSFESFEGVGPRRFFDLFSMQHGSGFPLERKESKSGEASIFDKKKACCRMPMLPWTYIDQESYAADTFSKKREEFGNGTTT